MPSGLTSYSSYRFIDPRTLAALGDLSLAARTVVDGFMYGDHRSRLPGAGLEFSQYRSYQPGDDLRRVDWKLYGRSDRYFIRESEIETSVTLRLVLDASGSMAHEEGGVSKFDYARFLAAALAVLAHRQGDAIGLHAIRDDGVQVLTPSREHRQLHRVLHTLEGLEPGGVWPPWERLEGTLAAGAPRGITLLLTDLHEKAEEIRVAAHKLGALRQEVVVFHLIGRAELEFSYQGTLTFEGLESGERVEVDTDAIRAAYLSALESQLRAIRVELEDRGAGYARFTLDEPLDGALRRYLRSRLRS